MVCRCMRSMISEEETDLIYEGIATPRTRGLPALCCREETDLIYEGIATICRYIPCPILLIKKKLT